MGVVEALKTKWDGIEHPFLIHRGRQIHFSELIEAYDDNINSIAQGEVVALIGDFNPKSIVAFLQLVDRGAIIVPLTEETAEQHEYFFDAACVNAVLKDGKLVRICDVREHDCLAELRNRDHAGLVLFSTGTTGRPKAILHDMTLFLKRFETPRPTLTTINFLLFDHIGGINTLLHTLFNKGTVVAPTTRSVEDVLNTCALHKVEVLPTTPTFLRMMLMSGHIPAKVPSSLKVITYGTERMDQATLDELCELLPHIDFRQTFGMSELGIVRVKSKARNSLYMKIGGEGIETRIVDGVLKIRSQTRMVGYLNAPSPFDGEGWYDTKDLVVEDNGFIKVTGRLGDIINVGGLKFLPSEVENVALQYPGVSLVKAYGRENPISGQHVEIIVEESAGHTLDKKLLLNFMKGKLQSFMVPKRITIGKVTVGHRFKRA
jgi:acyl-CoA synthetase (AMP-forming)/AMP-acid ligase II